MAMSPPRTSFEGPLRHLSATDASVADKSLAALSIALMCQEGTIPSEKYMKDMHDGLFGALNGATDELAVNTLLAIAAMNNMAGESFHVLTTGAQVADILNVTFGFGADATSETQDEHNASSNNSTVQHQRRLLNGLGAVASYARVDTPEHGARFGKVFLEWPSPEQPSLVEFIIELCALDPSMSVHMAGIDTLGALLSGVMGAAMKRRAMDAGMTQTLMHRLVSMTDGAGMTSNPSGHAFGTTAASEEEDQAAVLTLLCIGMVIHQDEKGQAYLSRSPDSVAWLLRSIRSKHDADIHALSADIMGVLSRSEAHNSSLAESIRSAQAAMEKKN